MQTLTTPRLTIRPFQAADLDAVHTLLDHDLAEADFGSSGALTRAQRKRWLRWTILSAEQHALLYQPPYGERAVIEKQSGELIGALGLVPSLAPFGQIPILAGLRGPDTRFYPEVGLYYAVSPARQGRGFASEAAAALAAWAFHNLRLRRLVATTSHDNLASQAVMRRIGMRIHANPLPDPHWFQVVGVMDAPD